MCVRSLLRPSRSDEIACLLVVAFKVYDMDRDGFISNGELFLVLKMMVGNNLKVYPADHMKSKPSALSNPAVVQDHQLQQIVDKTIMEADKDGDGKLSFAEFANMVSNTVSQKFKRSVNDLIFDHTGHCKTNDLGRSFLTKRYPILRIPVSQCAAFILIHGIIQCYPLTLVYRTSRSTQVKRHRLIQCSGTLIFSGWCILAPGVLTFR